MKARCCCADGIGTIEKISATVAWVGHAHHHPVLLEPLHRVGHARRVHLQPLADLAHRQPTRATERQQAQHLVPCEGQAVRSQDRLDPTEQHLLHPHDRGHEGHPVGGFAPAVPHPVGASEFDRIDHRSLPSVPGLAPLLHRHPARMIARSLAFVDHRTTRSCHCPSPRPTRRISHES
jgi:hypothetical protein